MSFTYPFQDVKAIKTIKAAVLHSLPSHFILLLFLCEISKQSTWMVFLIIFSSFNENTLNGIKGQE